MRKMQVVERTVELLTALELRLLLRALRLGCSIQ